MVSKIAGDAGLIKRKGLYGSDALPASTERVLAAELARAGGGDRWALSGGAWACTEVAPALPAGDGPEQVTGWASATAWASSRLWRVQCLCCAGGSWSGLAARISLRLLGAAFLAGCRGALLPLLLAGPFPTEQDTEGGPWLSDCVTVFTLCLDMFESHSVNLRTILRAVWCYQKATITQWAAWNLSPYLSGR